MTLSQQAARQEILAHIASAWAAGSAAIVGYVPEIRYQGVELPGLPGTDNYWMRASTNNVTTEQSGHAIDEPGVSEVIYTTFGFVTLQIFAPMKTADSYAKGELLSGLGQRMFMASETAGGIWFRNPRIRQLDNDGTWYRWNVIADYQFDQSKGA